MSFTFIENSSETNRPHIFNLPFLPSFPRRSRLLHPLAPNNINNLPARSPTSQTIFQRLSDLAFKARPLPLIPNQTRKIRLRAQRVLETGMSQPQQRGVELSR